MWTKSSADDDIYNGSMIPAVEMLLSSFVAQKNVTNSSNGGNAEYLNFMPIRSSTTEDAYYANVTNTIAMLLSTLVADGLATRTTSATYFISSLARRITVPLQATTY
jgi:hypothetical protein